VGTGACSTATSASCSAAPRAPTASTAGDVFHCTVASPLTSNSHVVPRWLCLSNNGACLSLYEVGLLRYNEQKELDPVYYSQNWDAQYVQFAVDTPFLALLSSHFPVPLYAA